MVNKYHLKCVSFQSSKAINESRELSDTLLRTLPSEVPETIFIHCSMSPLAKCIATHDIDFMLRRLVSTVKNVGKSKKQFNNFIKELSRNEKRFLNQCAYQTMREAQKHLYDSYAVENLRGLNTRMNFSNFPKNDHVIFSKIKIPRVRIKNFR